MTGHTRDTDPETSHIAAARAPTLALFSKYLMALYLRGPLTTTEIANHWNLPRDSFSPRTPDLLAKGYIWRMGRRDCTNPSGRIVQMNVHDLTPKGRAAIAQAFAQAKDKRK
jgi:DNA-binding MarR family transcriptional regulator